ncbi:hypothetical protein [Lysobacter sp. CFH 32150]|nr:hypothetical protein [Lysobacter sp. CFH 32150]
MRPAFDIANKLTLRPSGHGTAACAPTSCALVISGRGMEDALTID